MRGPWYRTARVLPLLWLVLTSCVELWAQAASADAAPVTAPAGRTKENWASLSLEGSDLQADPPIFGQKDENPLFTRELIRVKWRRGDPIDLYVIRPKGVSKKPVVLYLYSYPSETNRFRDDDYCGRLTRSGFAAIGFVSALTGHRYANRPMKEWFVSELTESLVSSVHDVQMILNYASTRDDLDVSKVGMFGAGSGGTIAILASAVDPRIKALDLLDPWGDWPDWMAQSSVIPDSERLGFVNPEFLKDVAWLDPVKWLPNVKAEHIRLQHVLDDQATPRIAKERLESAAPATTVIVKYDDTGQFFHAVSGGRIFQWVKDTLRPSGQKQTTSVVSSVSNRQTQ